MTWCKTKVSQEIEVSNKVKAQRKLSTKGPGAILGTEVDILKIIRKQGFITLLERL